MNTVAQLQGEIGVLKALLREADRVLESITPTDDAQRAQIDSVRLSIGCALVRPEGGDLFGAEA